MSHSFPTRLRVRHTLGCSVIALAAALAAPAAAQSFQGSANVVFGNANVVQGSGTTDVNIGSQSAVIDWTPSDTAIANGQQINWQSAGTTATFTGTAGNFAVLNRIVPADTSRPITFSGSVVSQFFQGQTPVRGGTVFFYSPGGIVLSPTAVFDVGNLGLTTAPPAVGPNGDWYTNNTVQFGQAASSSSVRIEAGAQIGAAVQGSYVAVFAPYIEHAGTITSNGQVALVAGEAGTINFSPDGLFDIQVTTGSDGAGGLGINQSGTTTGGASTGTGDNRRVYLVAVPKNNLLTMAIQRGASLGFDIAAAANVQGNAVVLSAGYNVTDGVTETARAGGPGTASISINDSNANLPGAGITFTSGVDADASADLFVDVFRQTRFAGNSSLRADATSIVTVSRLTNQPAGSLTADRDLTISATRLGTLGGANDAGLAQLVLLDGAGATITGNLLVEANANRDASGNGVATAGTAQALVSGASTLTVSGNLLLTGNAFTGGATGAPDATGGNVQLNLSGASTVSVGGVTRVLSYGSAGLNNGTSGQGADGRGGFSELAVSGGSTFTTNELNIAADGVGGADAGAGGGAAFGGTASIAVTGTDSRLTVNSANVTGNVSFGERDFLSAEAFGGQTAFANSTGGSAQGGSASISASGGAQIALPANTGQLMARILGRATGGSVVAGVDGTGGAATGGSVAISLDNATLTGGALQPSSFAFAGSSTNPGLATSVINGGNAIGGTRTISIVNGSTFSAQASGGGPGAQGGNGSAIGRGGDGTGGTAITLVDASTLNVPVGGFGTFTQNFTGSGGVYGNTSGGVTDVTIRNGSAVNLANGATFGVTATNFTDIAAFTGPAQSGGNVTGGSAVLRVLDSTITGQGQVNVAAHAATQHSALVGGNALGGTARLEVTNGTISVGSIGISADGIGSSFIPEGNGVNGAAGGTGTGGNAFAILNGANLTATDIDISAEGEGGDVSGANATGGSGGAATGGTAILQAASGTNTLTATNLRVDAAAQAGGADTLGDLGGAGTGGEARIDALAGASLTVNATTEIVASGDGGSVSNGTGGAATGGRAYSFANGGSITFDGSLMIEALAESGDGIVGGAATGGIAYLQSFTNGTTTVNGDVFVRADAQGAFPLEAPATGGSATGGSAQILATNGNARLTINGSAFVSAKAFGGIGERDAAGNGGDGGAATGGLAEIGGDVGTGNAITISGPANLEASADGGFGIASSGGNATGGRALVNAGNGTSLTFAGEVIASADASGGFVSDSNGVTAAPGTRGGDATGGVVRVRTFNTGGAITIGGGVLIETFALGGDAFNPRGDGGDATAGSAQVFADNGSIAITGQLLGGVDALGGSGDTGGDALIATNGPVEALVGATNGTVTVSGQTLLFASAAGGDGRGGGAGGSALAGRAIVDAANSAAGASTIQLADLLLFSSAQGAAGGSGSGVAGGAGGSATGSAVQVWGTAGNGTLRVSGTTQVLSIAAGGVGGNSDTGAGGTGGAASGGFINFGTKSGIDTGPTNTGSASFATLSASNQAVGGAGGASTSGAGGAGGDARAGGVVLQSRGSPLTADDVALGSLGFGGAGGGGATTGAGGFGAGGTVYLVASQRFQRTERGSATIGTLSMSAFGLGGTGSTDGASYYAGDGGVSLIQSDVTVGSLSYANAGVTPPPPAVIDPLLPISLTLSDSALTVTTLSMTTPGEFLLDLDNSRIDAGSFAISAGTFVLPAATPANPGTITVTDSFLLAATATGGSVRTFANFISNNTASITAADSIVLGNIDADGLFEAQSLTGTVTVGNIDAGSANVTARGNVQAGNVSVGGQFVAESSGGSVSVGTVDAGSALLVAQGNVQAGNVRVGGQFVAESSGGSVSVGTLDAQSVRLLAQTDVTGQRITASDIHASAGGTVNVLGAWTSPSIEISANDIAIPDGGALTAGAAGSIDLVTLNSAGAFIGDGLPGQGGFRLSNGEFGRITGNSIFLGVRDGANEVDLTIGTLTMSSSQLPGLDGEFEFATGNAETFAASGRIRVEGAVSGSGFSASQFVTFGTGSFELNAETGSLSLTGNGPGGLGGILVIEAENIHIASPAILTKLRADPRYSGVADELNAPAAIQRPDGVLRALGIEFYPGDTLYIQNTGTAANPSGFYTTLEESHIEVPGAENAQAADVDVIINGRFATASGDITGRGVFTAIVEGSDDGDADFAGISDISQVNGCAFASELCGSVIEETPVLAVLQSEIELLTGQKLEEDPFDLDESGEEEEEEAEKAARAPIEPPVVLIDTRPLNPPVDIVDPVSGSGNPASLSQEPATPGTGDDQ